MCVNGVLSRASSKPSQISRRFSASADARHVARVARSNTSGSLEKMCSTRATSGALEAPSGPPPRATCAARRARRLPSASRAHPDPDEHGRRVGRRRSLRRPRAPRRAQELRRRRGSPGIGRRARRHPPRSRCVPPGSPRSGRGDAAWTSSATLSSIVPRARGRALRTPRTRPRAAADPHSADKAIVVGINSLSSRSRRAASVRSASSPPAARAHSLSNAPP